LSEPRILIIDPQMAGVAGDMFVAALIDLGAPSGAVIAAMESTPEYVSDCKSVRVTPRAVERSHLRGLYLDVKVEESFESRSGKVLISAVEAMASDLRLSPPASAYAQRAIRLLVETEATVHQATVDTVHLHGAGSADTVLDVIGAATALDQLGLANPATTSYHVLPVAVGGGTFGSSHGQLAAPGPAITRILTNAGLRFRGGPVERELATPTGGALIAALNPTSSQFYPSIRPLKVGYGAGTWDLPGLPNLLRMVVGEPIATMPFAQDSVVLLETNVDDVPGETLGYVIDQLMTAGAKDVVILPTTTKKSRPGHLISVIAAPEDEQRLTHLLMSETGTLGVRVLACNRHVLARETVPVQITLGKNKFEIGVKIATDQTGLLISVKPEHEDIRKAAAASGQPLTAISRLAENAARDALAQKGGKRPRHRKSRS
jgi:uncharacterized protein (TIGR00299 family) protein